MRYFSDEKLSEMREQFRSSAMANNGGMVLAYRSKIELLDKRNDEYGDCREELFRAISELQSLTENYIHRGKADPNDEDADAFEYENYYFRQTTD